MPRRPRSTVTSTTNGCQSWNNSFGFNNKPGNYVPHLGCGSGAGRRWCHRCRSAHRAITACLPAALVYDPVTNPTGTRCGDPDLATAVWGSTDNAMAPGSTPRIADRRQRWHPVRAEGAAGDGAITPEEFVTLNEKVGGTDADSNRTPARSTADLPALDIAYRAGIVASGRNLGKLPIIDSRGYDEQGIHYIWRSFSERARIDAANHGEHGNQVMWRYGTGLLPATAAQFAAVTLQSFLTMDTWLTNLLASAPKATLNSVRTQAQVIAAKPSSAFDLCYLTGDTTFSTKVTDMAVCDADPRLQKHASPRQVAGGPLAENILKCQLKPINTAEYLPATFSAEQLLRLYTTFPGGVCDWSKPGVGQQRAQAPLTFAAGPGGKRLAGSHGSRDDRYREHDDD